MSRLRLILIWAISQIVTLIIIAEVVLRFLFPVAVSPSYGFFPDNPYVFDSAIGWRQATGEYEFRQPEFATVFQVNRQGFRGSEDFEPGGIAVIGDSFVQALQVSEADTFISLIDGQNFGASSIGMPHYLAIYRHQVRPLRPKTVIVIILPKNDIRNSSPTMPNKPELKPNYVYDQAGNVTELKSFGYHSGLMKAETKKSLFHWSAISRFVLWRQNKVNFDTQDGITLDAMGYVEPWPDEFAEAWKHLEWSLLTLIDEIEADNSQAIIVNMPSRWESDGESWAIIESQYTGNGSLEIDKPRLKLAETVADSGVLYLDLTERFRKVYQDGNIMHYPVDGHLTIAGHKIVADELRKVLH